MIIILKTALFLYLQSPIRNTYLDRFYLFHIIDNEIKEFYSVSNYATYDQLSYNHLRTGLINNKKIEHPGKHYSTVFSLWGLILFIFPYLIDILNNHFFNSNLLSVLCIFMKIFTLFLSLI